MPFVLGIDEAGYGPMLGPLLVGATLWRVEPRKADGDLWRELKGCMTRKPRKSEWRLHVDDSKAVFDRARGAASLERSVLGCAAVAGLTFDNLSALLRAVADDWAAAHPIPWYQDLSTPLPLDPARACSPTITRKLSEVMESAGVRLCHMAARVVTEERFNHRVEATHSKGAIVVEQVLRLIEQAAEQTAAQDLHIHVDRLGGRTDYRGLLQTAFPNRALTELEVGPRVSRYRLSSQSNDWIIDFSVDADKKHLPVALASMLAKYIRELLMDRFNAYWQRFMPTLIPTAGYYNDAQRFLADIEQVIDRSGVPRGQFIRTR